MSASLGLFASLLSLRRRATAGWGIAGLCLAMPFLALLVSAGPWTLAVCAALLGLGFRARWRWRAYQARHAEWRAGRALMLEQQVQAIRRHREA